MSKTVKVGCRIPNGARLVVSDVFDDPLNPGQKQFREVGLVELAGAGVHTGGPGLLPEDQAPVSEVDAGLFNTWWTHNQSSDLVTSGAVFKAKAKDETVEDKAEADAKDEQKVAEMHAEEARVATEQAAEQQASAAPEPATEPASPAKKRGRAAS